MTEKCHWTGLEQDKGISNMNTVYLLKYCSYNKIKEIGIFSTEKEAYKIVKKILDAMQFTSAEYFLDESNKFKVFEYKINIPKEICTSIYWE